MEDPPLHSVGGPKPDAGFGTESDEIAKPPDVCSTMEELPAACEKASETETSPENQATEISKSPDTCMTMGDPSSTCDEQPKLDPSSETEAQEFTESSETCTAMEETTTHVEEPLQIECGSENQTSETTESPQTTSTTMDTPQLPCDKEPKIEPGLEDQVIGDIESTEVYPTMSYAPPVCDVKPKVEPGSNDTPREVSASSGKEIAMADPASHCDKRPKVEPSLDNPVNKVAEFSGCAWQMCSEQPDAHKIAIKEHSVERAIFLTSELCDLLRDALKDDDFPGADNLRHWINRVDELVKQHHDCEILVGVAGQTGAGKTSLLNALFGLRDLLPSGHEQAATAVSCKVSWNYDLKPGHEYIAEVYFQSTEQVQQQLCDTLDAIILHDKARTGSYADEDQRREDLAEYAAMMQEGLNKIFAVWRIDEGTVVEDAKACRTTDQRQAAAMRILRSNRDVVRLLQAGTKVLHNSDPEQLAEEIKPYLDSTSARHGNGSKSEFAAWPLIRTVNLYIRSDILKSGISLVDLPGIGDSVKSRSDVARDYYSQLKLKLIVAGSARAADDQSTQGLMNEEQELRMQMKGQYHDTGFGVILSKMDDISFEAYLKSKKVAAGNPVVQQHEKLAAEAKKEMKKLGQERTQSMSIVTKQSANLKKLKEKLEKLPPGDSPRSIKIGGSMSAAKRTIENARDTLDKISLDEMKQTKMLRLSQGHLKHSAMTARHEFIRERMLVDFTRRHQRQARNNGTDASESAFGELKIMSTSVEAFWELQCKGEQPLGFPTEQYTGIPHVKQWIHKATALYREKHLDTILSGFDTVRAGLDNCSRDIKTDEQVRKIDHKGVEQGLKNSHELFDKRLKLLFKQLQAQIVQLDPFQNSEDAKTFFRCECKQTANRWVLKYPQSQTDTENLHFSVYKAIVRRYGGPYQSSAGGGYEYNWIRSLNLTLLKVLIKDWNEQINGRVPALWSIVEGVLDKIWDEYTRNLLTVTKRFDASLARSFEGIQDGVLSAKTHANTRGRKLLDDFPTAVSQSFDNTEVVFRDFMHTAFEKALDIHDKRAYMKMRELLERFVSDKSGKMFKASCSSAKHVVEKKKAKLQKKLDDIADQASKTVQMQAKSHLDNILGQHDAAGDTTLRGRMQKLLAQWLWEWQCPKGYENHILLQDLQIPSRIYDDDLKIIEEESEDISDLEDLDEDDE